MLGFFGDGLALDCPGSSTAVTAGVVGSGKLMRCENKDDESGGRDRGAKERVRNQSYPAVVYMDG